MSRPPTPAARLAAAAVHAYTASGALLALLAGVAVVDGDYRAAFAWLSLQVAVDASDGWLARAARVTQVVPAIDGARLDDIVDYLTYVFVPALMVVRVPLAPSPAVAWTVAAAMLLSSAAGFSRAEAKTADHFFTGFPSYWNVVVLYLVAFGTPPAVSAALLLVLAALVFVPVRYIYPSRTTVLQGLTVGLGLTWSAAMLVVIWQLPDVSRPLLTATLAFPLYYVALSLALEWKRARAAQGAGLRA